MARDYKKLSRRARHLIRRLRGEKHAAVQRIMVHELTHEINRRRWGRTLRTAPAQPGAPGNFRPLTRRAKGILARLRKTRVWSVQKRLVAELKREMERGVRARERAARAARRAREAAQRAARVAAKAGRDGRRAATAAARAARVGAREAARLGRAAAQKARPIARKARAAAQRARARIRHRRRRAPRRRAVPRGRATAGAVPVRPQATRPPRATRRRVPRTRSARP